MRLIHALAIGVSVSALQAAGAVAQTKPQTQSAIDLGEVVVTARKVEERLQQVPVAVTAYSGEQMRTKGILQPQDLQNSTPSLTVAGAAVQARNSATYSIRGQGNAGSTSGAPPGVPIYFADAPVGTGSPTFFDMANIQVLKGPQGTLFGRTSTGGAVLLNPERANAGGFDAYAQARLGDLSYKYFEGMVNIPVIQDKLAVRVAGNIVKRRGFTKSLDDGRWYDDLDRQALRISVQFKPASFIENHAMLQWERYDENGSSYLLGSANTGIAALNTTAAGFATVCGNSATASGLGVGAPNRAAYIDGCAAQRVQILADIRAGVNAERNRIESGAQGGIRAWRTNAQGGVQPYYYNTRKFFVNDLRLHAPDFGPVKGLTVRNVYSRLFDSNFQLVANLDGTQFPLLEQVFNAISSPSTCSTAGADIGQCRTGALTVVDAPYNSYDIPNYSNEVNITGTIADVFRFTLGNYYFQVNIDQQDFLYTAFNSTFGLTTQPTLNNVPNSFGAGHVKQLEQGNFAQGDLDLSRWIHGLSITAGIRKTLTKSEITNRRALQTNASGFSLSGPVVNRVNTHTLSFNQKVTDRITVYGRTSTGYKPGGLNVPCAPGGALAVGGIACPSRYEPESVKDYELGIKTDWRIGDVVGRTNADVYKMDWSGIQRQVRVIGNSYITNAALGRIKGFELEQTLAIGDHWLLNGNYSYTKARYLKWWDTAPGFPCTDNVNNSAGNCINYAGTPFQNTPKNQINLSARYSMPLAYDRGTLSATVNWYHQSSAVFADNPNVNPNTVSPPYSIANARVDWKNMFGRPIDGAIVVRNLFDKDYTIYRGDSASAVGVAYWQWAEPRTWYIELRYRFGRGAL